MDDISIINAIYFMDSLEVNGYEYCMLVYNMDVCMYMNSSLEVRIEGSVIY